jgi:hypothetical protein
LGVVVVFDCVRERESLVSEAWGAVARSGGLRPLSLLRKHSSLRGTDRLMCAKCVFFHREGAEERRESALRTLRLRGEKKKVKN